MEENKSSNEFPYWTCGNKDCDCKMFIGMPSEVEAASLTSKEKAREHFEEMKKCSKCGYALNINNEREKKLIEEIDKQKEHFLKEKNL